MTDASRLSEDEQRSMFTLLARYVATDLDQWENWRVSTAYGDVFVEVRRTTASDASAYDDITAWLDRG